jgi:hypothetical protein
MPSNLYAEKIFAEHPLALWSFDEQADYISYISEAERNMASATYWTKGGSGSSTTTATNYSNISIPYSPLVSNTTKIAKTFSGASTISTSFTSVFSKSIDGSTVSFYAYPDSADIESVDVKVGTQSAQREYFYNRQNRWVLISKTFSDSSSTSNIVITINYRKTSSTSSTANLYINALTYGYKSEEFNGASLGVTPTQIPSDIDLSGTNYGILGTSYASSNNGGYYLANTNNTRLFAKNTTMPMVYGASNSTVVIQNTDGSDSSPKPSAIIPGFGFLNEYGKNQEYTFESWFRINSNATTFRRIFGPINSTDGLYVKGPFLSLKIGKTTKSHYVGEWFRPMLVQVSISKNGTALFVNGERIFLEAINISEQETVLSNLKINDSTSKNQDWLGFYAYSDVPTLEIDGVAIYPYAVSDILAKRRFVYGQAVEYPTNLDAYYGGSSVAIDYSVSNYTKNYNYPETASWKSGVSEAVKINTNFLSNPEYTLPKIIIGSNSETYSESALMNLNNAAQSGTYSFITLKPTGWSSIDSYIYFENLNIFNEQVQSIQSVFKNTTTTSQDQTLIKLSNKINGDYIKAYINNTTISYESSFAGNSNIFKTITGITSGKQFSVGLDINALIALDSTYRLFFSNPSQIQVFVGGDNDGGAPANTFTGYTYNVGFSTLRNFSKIATAFNSDGTAKTTTGVVSTLLSHTSTYKLFLNNLVGYSELDIAVNSYWQDYVPLTSLGKYVTLANGNTGFSLDYVQLNIDYPELFVFDGNSFDTSGSILKSYATFQYIQDGANKDILDASFTNVGMSKFGTVEPGSDWQTSKYEVVNNAIMYLPTSNIESGKTIEDLALVLHIELETPGIINNPIKLKYLQLASRSLNHNYPESNENPINQIGTKFNKNIYPYKIVNGIKNYQSKNPLRIYKGNNPYLYLTNQSGIQVSGQYDSNIDRGIEIGINDRRAKDFSVSSMQISLLYNLDSFSSTPTKMFELNSSSGTYKFYSVSTNTTSRGKIFGTIVKNRIVNATESSGTVTYTTSGDHYLSTNDIITVSGNSSNPYVIYNEKVTSVPTSNTFTISSSATGSFPATETNLEKLLTGEIAYLWDGKPVANPFMNIKEWGTLSLAFTTFLDFGSAEGNVKITGPILFNNFSYYTIDPTQQGQQIIQRSWSEVKDYGDWESLKAYTILGSSELPSWGISTLSQINVNYALDPQYIYSIFLGNNKLIADTQGNSGMVRFKSYEYLAYQDVQSTFGYYIPA